MHETRVRVISCTSLNGKWADGHTARRNDNRWTTRIMDWQPRTGKRNRGRQRRRWRDDIRAHYAGLEQNGTELHKKYKLMAFTRGRVNL